MMKGQIVQAVVQDSAWVTASTGTPGLRIFCEVTDPNGLEEPKRISGTIWFSENNMKQAKRQLRNLGFDADKINVALIGREGYEISGHALEVQLDEYKGAIQIGFFGVMNVAPTAAAIDAIGESLKKIKDDEGDEPAHGKIPKHGTSKPEATPF